MRFGRDRDVAVKATSTEPFLPVFSASPAAVGEPFRRERTSVRLGRAFLAHHPHDAKSVTPAKLMAKKGRA